MSKSARIALLLVAMFLIILLTPAYMGHVLGGITAGFVALGVAIFAVIASAGAVVLSAAVILTAFLAVCVVLLVALSPILVPVALFAGFIWLIVKLCSRRGSPPEAPAPPSAAAPAV